MKVSVFLTWTIRFLQQTSSIQTENQGTLMGSPVWQKRQTKWKKAEKLVDLMQLGFLFF